MKINGTFQLSPHERTRIEQAMQYIAKNFQKRISVETISEELDIRIPELQSGFKEVTGLTIHSYLNTVRLEEAKKILVDNPDHSIKQIACSIGFKRTSHFSRLFKVAFGTTPLTYRLVAFGLKANT